VLPAYAAALERSPAIGRLLAWLVAAIAEVHGSALLRGGLLKFRDSLASGADRSDAHKRLGRQIPPEVAVIGES
jgi:hypothetical protein